MNRLADCRLYGILDLGYVAPPNAVTVARAMAAGGVDIVQLRAKDAPPATVESLAQLLRPALDEAGVPLIINDHPAIAARVGAAGAHVGQDDLPVAAARRLAGGRAIIGKSTHGLAQAVAAATESPDYIGFGPLFATPTKPAYRPVGLADIRPVQAAVAVPVFCIGGIKRENLARVIAAGARRVVIVSGILQAPDIAAYCRAVKALLPPLTPHRPR